MMKWLLYSLAMLSTAFKALGQSQMPEIEMADQFRSDGKIYIVVIVILIIVLTLSFYAFRLDRKISKLEEKTSSKND